MSTKLREAVKEEVQWSPGGKEAVLAVYERLHKDKIIGEHWLWALVKRISLGENTEHVFADYGYVPAPPGGKGEG